MDRTDEANLPLVRDDDDDEINDDSSVTVEIKKTLLERARSHRSLVPLIVFMALLLDAVLTTCVVPIIPEILHQNGSDISIGFLLGSKSFFQLISNTVVGPYTDRFGFNAPMVTGFVLLTSSTLFFAFAPDMGRGSRWNTYAALFVARSVEGVGCSCVTTAGMAMVADRYPDQQERGAVMGKVLGGLALGLLVGYPFGGAFSAVPGGIEKGWRYPFLIISCLGFIDLLLQLLVLGWSTSTNRRETEPSSMLKLIRDRYIVTALVALFVSQLAISSSEPILPAWMETHFTKPTPEAWQIGLVIMSSMLAYIIVTLIASRAKLNTRWIVTLFGISLLFLGTLTLPLTVLPDGGNLYFIILPLVILGVGIGMADSTLFPTMGMLVDIRHSSEYGAVYGLADIAISLSFVIGPIAGSLVNQFFGFGAAIWCVSALCGLVVPSIWCLRSLRVKEDSEGNGNVTESIELQSHEMAT
ncbi:chromaffin granule amine transporter-like isoform X1 [Corticium candelabrum]|uniref:chromaffin granule amine transporter-like isoform X1 n=2 Tax=Corticium candelabrum TaxID=121492 RepID=UPI002E273579|nr:chromaffin granule amine transporter-like isoform X1 [Corticium candelabrum]